MTPRAEPRHDASAPGAWPRGLNLALAPDGLNLARLAPDVSMAMAPTRLAGALLAAGLAVTLAGCGSARRLPGDDAPTLQSLAGREAPMPPLARLPTSEEQALRAWRELLAAQPDPKQRAQALRRLGDLEMDRTDAALARADVPGNPDYRAAIADYQDYLKTYPQDPGNDRVLYQLARAHEQGGDLDNALKSLDRLVEAYPTTRYRDEAQFRRGELLFTARQYPAAEAAYATVLASDAAGGGVYRDRALYMQGWSQFKQGRLEPALASFLTVLDGKLAGRDDALPLEELPDLSRADRELVEDSFRVTSLALENLQGPASIAPLVTTPARQSYQVRIYQQLAALYRKQDRPKDAADTLQTFTRLQPLHAMAPVLQEQVIGIHTDAGFDQQALAAKQDFVTRYGAKGEFRRASPVAWSQAQPLVKTHLGELARHFHAAAQRSHQRADVQQAVALYQALLESFPGDAESVESHFLLAELLFEDQRFADAASAYEKTAYGYPAHARSADAGYAALLAWAAQLKAAPAEQQAGLQRDGVASARRFAKAFPTDSRNPAVLANAASTLLQLGDGAQAAEVATQLLALQPPPPDEPRRVAHSVLATTRFDAGDFAAAERQSSAALALTAANAPGRTALSERLAAAIYKQGEQARDAGQAREAATLFARVGDAAPQSGVRVAAQFDAAAQLLALKDWPAAAKLLEDFRQRFPNDPLQAQVPARLALAYTEQSQWAPAAAEYERIATAATDAELARQAQWQAAELYDKAQAAPGAPPAARAAAAKAWERGLRSPGLTLALATEARARLAALAKAGGDATREAAWQRELVAAERAGGSARTDRSRALSAQAALALAAPDAEAYRKIALVEPLQKNLALKKAKLRRCSRPTPAPRKTAAPRW